jgi:hypothetical protein
LEKLSAIYAITPNRFVVGPLRTFWADCCFEVITCPPSFNHASTFLYLRPKTEVR